MRNVIFGVLEKTIDQLPEDQIIGLTRTLSLNPEEVPIFYGIVNKRGYKEALFLLHQKTLIRNCFLILDDLYENWLVEERYDLLALPYFSTDYRSFSKLCDSIIHKKFKLSHRMLRAKTEQYGMTFLNNMFLLIRLFRDIDPSPYVLHFCNLDHSKALSPEVGEIGRRYVLLLKHYSVKRFFRLLLTVDESVAGDLRSMLYELTLIEPEATRRILPRKPRTLRELHDAIDRELLKRKSDPDIPLNQSISSINGYKCGDYIIEVPSKSGDLQATSIELKHCVHTYLRRIQNKRCEIFNLVQEGKRKYTVEIHKTNEGYSIAQIKGLRNDNQMEGHEGESLKRQILDVLGRTEVIHTSFL